ncbi:hypothetical protein FTUN_3259 [Frigoriglobus tundricola]|uniref:Uncharacterized protein n=1 Tax=Frigoriglobus tundricola TaxID=2774151 RepID=A0A6M5YNY8_9BACT|nr:hypothetical protein FTUN_3259 [Frigoriglobus tundricola]
MAPDERPVTGPPARTGTQPCSPAGGPDKMPADDLSSGVAR